MEEENIITVRNRNLQKADEAVCHFLTKHPAVGFAFYARRKRQSAEEA